MTVIRRDLSSLPRAEADGGVRPDADPFIGRAVTSLWLLDNHSDSKPHAVPGTKFRFSSAGMCSQSLAFYFKGVEPTNIPDSADAWRMGLGTMVHESVQSYFKQAVKSWMPDEINGRAVKDVRVEFEKAVHLPALSASGSADMVIDYLDALAGLIWRQVVEIKTINGFGFKMAATGFKGPAQGPRLSHVQQAALCARGLDADEMIICYLSMENVSPSLASSYCDDPEFGRFTAQWSYDRAEIERVSDQEMNRVFEILREVDQSEQDVVLVPRRVYNDKGELVTVTDPRSGAWSVTSADGQIVDAGKTWTCGYCRYQDLCVSSQHG